MKLEKMSYRPRKLTRELVLSLETRTQISQLAEARGKTEEEVISKVIDRVYMAHCQAGHITR